MTKDDFELFENGKPQPLTNFFEIGSQSISVAVFDRLGARTGFARTTVIVL